MAERCRGFRCSLVLGSKKYLEKQGGKAKATVCGAHSVINAQTVHRFVGTQLSDRLKTGFLVVLGNLKAHGAVKAQSQTCKSLPKLAACEVCWVVYTARVLFHVDDMGEEASYLRSTGEAVGDCKLQWFRALSEQKRNVKRPTYHRANKFVPVPKMAKALCPLGGWWTRSSRFHSDRKWNAALCCWLWRADGAAARWDFATGKPPASSRLP